MSEESDPRMALGILNKIIRNLSNLSWSSTILFQLRKMVPQSHRGSEKISTSLAICHVALQNSQASSLQEEQLSTRLAP